MLGIFHTFRSMATRADVSRSVFGFVAVNALVSLALASVYFFITPNTPSGVHALFGVIMLFTTVGIFYLVYWGVLALLRRILPGWIIFALVAATSATAIHFATILDIVIYRVYRFHVNGMVINLFTTEGAWDSVHPGFWPVVVGAVVLAGGLAGEFLLVAGSRVARDITGIFARPRVRWAIVAAFLVLLLGDKLTFAMATFNGDTRITRMAHIYPAYVPLNMNRFFDETMGLKPKYPQGIAIVDDSQKGLDYPKQELVQGDAPDAYPNVVIIVLDAYRSDMLDPDVTPNIAAFAEQGIVLENHYSSGNTTRFGIFGLFYGIYSSYWHRFLEEQRTPVLIDELEKVGYDFKILSSTRLSYPEFRSTAFASIQDDIEDELPGNGSNERDLSQAKRFREWLNQRVEAGDEAPFFSFLFFDSSHGGYYYPDRYEKFTPAMPRPNYITIGSDDMTAARNAYQNALFYEDDLVGGILDDMKKHGMLDNTIVMITGDHGEEFMESGQYGHNSGFSEEQSKVPFVVHVPGSEPRRISGMTSHLDVPATILARLGYTTDPSAYSQGADFLGEDFDRDSTVVCKWGSCALMDEEHTIIFPTSGDRAMLPEVRTPDYAGVDDERSVIEARSAELVELMGAMSTFYR